MKLSSIGASAERHPWLVTGTALALAGALVAKNIANHRDLVERSVYEVLSLNSKSPDAVDFDSSGRGRVGRALIDSRMVPVAKVDRPPDEALGLEEPGPEEVQALLAEISGRLTSLVPKTAVLDILPEGLDEISRSPEGRERLRLAHFRNGIFMPPTKSFYQTSWLHHYFRNEVTVNGRLAVFRGTEEGVKYNFLDGKKEVVVLRVGDAVLGVEEEELILESLERQKLRSDFLGENSESMESLIRFWGRRSMVHYLEVFGDSADKIFVQRMLAIHRNGVFGGTKMQNRLLFRYFKGIDFERFQQIAQGVTPDKELVAELIKKYFPKSQWNNALRVAEKEGKYMPFSLNPASANKGGGNDIGLFQLNDKWQALLLMEEGLSSEDLLDPEINVRLAAKIKSKSGWGAWYAARELGIR